MAVKRAEVEYSGAVQRVGFRFTAERLARRAGLSGYVKNLYNGGVELAAEGEEAVVRAFLDDIDGEMGRYIDGRSVEWLEPKEGPGRFEIKF
ncbi:MAG TPA: acylphosphatase [Candidatus Omnitrophota bacterium]|nr:acylphosphatase [Candidatus Omnitrophota bacterium]